MNPNRAVAKALMSSRNPKDRIMGRMLARGRVRPGPALELAIRLSSSIMRDAGGGAAASGGTSGPATGNPMTSAQTYTPTADSGKKKRVSRLASNPYANS